MPYFNQQQQQPGHFSFLDQLEAGAHAGIGYTCGAVFAVGGFFYGLDHPQYPLVLFIGLGLVGGLLIVSLLKHAATFLIFAAMICAAGFGTFYLFSHTAELRQAHSVPAVRPVHAAPAGAAKPAPGGLLDDLRKAVEK